MPVMPTPTAAATTSASGGVRGEVSELIRGRLDAITQLARTWRYAASGSPLVMGAAGGYLKARLDALGGITPAISKALSER
jgi:hypothetical protein